jgi:hypothetical protein
MNVLIKQTGKHDDQFRVNGLPRHIVSALVTEFRCPICLGHLGAYVFECMQCGWDAAQWVESSKADHERAHDRREP